MPEPIAVGPPAGRTRTDSSGRHLSIETMARWLGGELDPEMVQEILLPHLLAVCPACRTTRDQLDRLVRDSHHWNPAMALSESREVPGLWARLEALPYEEQLRLVQEDETFQLWMLCRLLAERSLDAAQDQPRAAVLLSSLALAVCAHLDPAYDLDWVADLNAECLACAAHARRAGGDLDGAEKAFNEARSAHTKSGTGSPLVAATIDRLEALLRRDQRLFPEALLLLDRAWAVYSSTDPELRDLHLAREIRATRTACRQHMEQPPLESRAPHHQALPPSTRKRPDARPTAETK
jgi:hypothetical protein